MALNFLPFLFLSLVDSIIIHLVTKTGYLIKLAHLSSLLSSWWWGATYRLKTKQNSGMHPSLLFPPFLRWFRPSFSEEYLQQYVPQSLLFIIYLPHPASYNFEKCIWLCNFPIQQSLNRAPTIISRIKAESLTHLFFLCPLVLWFPGACPSLLHYPPNRHLKHHYKAQHHLCERASGSPRAVLLYLLHAWPQLGLVSSLLAKTLPTKSVHLQGTTDSHLLFHAAFPSFHNMIYILWGTLRIFCFYPIVGISHHALLCVCLFP